METQIFKLRHPADAFESVKGDNGVVQVPIFINTGMEAAH